MPPPGLQERWAPERGGLAQHTAAEIAAGGLRDFDAAGARDFPHGFERGPPLAMGPDEG